MAMIEFFFCIVRSPIMSLAFMFDGLDELLPRDRDVYWCIDIGMNYCYRALASRPRSRHRGGVSHVLVCVFRCHRDALTTIDDELRLLHHQTIVGVARESEEGRGEDDTCALIYYITCLLLGNKQV